MFSTRSQETFTTGFATFSDLRSAFDETIGLPATSIGSSAKHRIVNRFFIVVYIYM